MAKFRCVCAATIHTSGSIPNDQEWRIISDVEFDRFEGLVDAEEIYRASRSAFLCPSCGRLWIFWRGMDQSPKCYSPEILSE
jgi:hypothetical protein